LKKEPLVHANYHTHTARCRHADGSERDYIEEAIKQGFHTLGFADHSPYIFEDGYYSSFRMRPEELEDYVLTLSALKEEYKNDIRICIGLEAEYYPSLFGGLADLLRSSGVEYLIMGQHYAKKEPSPSYSGRPSDDVGRLKDYVDSVIEGAESGFYAYIAHPDILNFTGDPDLYLCEMERLVKGVVKADIPFEMNILGLREGRVYPKEAFWQLVAKHGGKAIFGFDAHVPVHVYDEETSKRGIALLEKLGIERTEEIDLQKLKRL
jgi:histidinol-phosphatase (PHP family)